MIVFDIEDKINQLFEEVYPHVEHGDPQLNSRAFKPLICESLGVIVPDVNLRRQIKNREYFKVDLDDFLEFSTSELTKDSLLDHFPNNTLQIYSFQNSDETGIATEYLGSKVEVLPLDLIIARHEDWVSITSRISYKDPISKKWIGFDNQRWEELITLYYSPSDNSHPGTGSQLIEWERYIVWCPSPTDKEWRFIVADGVYPEYIKRCILNNKSLYGENYIIELVESSKKEILKYAVQIEVTRLCLCLPQYIKFMYDLISTERIKARKQTVHSGETSTTKFRRADIVYKIVKSINVIRPSSNDGSSIMKWTSPRRKHMVSSHWRIYNNGNASGKDQYGKPVTGKTWIKSHSRGKSQIPLPDIQESDTNTIIYVKQTLESARDELKARVGNFLEDKTISIQKIISDNTKTPTREWMANERAKLTAGLRYLILKRDNFSCRCCGVSPADTYGISLEVDHIIPIEKWGLTHIDNLQTLCKNCNRGKGTRA